jgi:hypothetical protein
VLPFKVVPRSLGLSLDHRPRRIVPRSDKAAELWKSTDDVWWSGPHDPNVRVLRVTPLTAELWDGAASETIVAYEFAKARLTGTEPNLGQNRKVT